MSSVPNSGPYQSRVFNFVAKRSRQLGDRLSLALRHAKVASNWGIQLLLYPLYVVVQGTRVATQRLQPKQQPTPSEVSVPPANDDVAGSNSDMAVDTPIQNVLEALHAVIVSPEKATETPTKTATETTTTTPAIGNEQETTPSPQASPGWPRFLQNIIHQSRHWWHQYVVKSHHQSPTHQGSDATLQQQLFFNLDSRDLDIAEIPLPPQQEIQAVATQLDGQTLVLVTPEQEIVDILTPQQRQAVCQRIARELSTYHRHSSLAVVDRATGEIAGDPPSQPIPHSARSWWEKLWDWMQTSPVAVKANLFSESSLVDPPSTSMATTSVAGSALQVETDPEKALETAFLEWVCYHSPQTWRRFGAALECALAKVESGQRSPQSDLGTVLIERGKAWLQHEPVQWRNYQIQFHWGDPWEEHPHRREAQQYIYDLIQTAIAYFFARRVHPSTNDSQFHSFPSHKHTSASFSDRMLRWWQNVKAGTLPPYRYPKFELIQENENWLTMEELFGRAKAYCITKLEDSPTAVVETAQTNRESNSYHRSPSLDSSQISSHPGLWETADGEWIDTEAISLGYDRHPLQIVLEKLDRLMLWLETWWDQIWQWFRQKLDRQT